MKIKKNGKVINLTESDLRRILKKVIKEQDEEPDYDYETASNFAKSVKDWWKGSGNWFYNPTEGGSETDYVTFFKKFQSSDDAAAIAYKNKVMNDLNKEVDDVNIYYDDIVSWIERIVDEIDDWFQSTSQTWLHLNSKDGRSSSFNVDPEIDV